MKTAPLGTPPPPLGTPPPPVVTAPAFFGSGGVETVCIKPIAASSNTFEDDLGLALPTEWNFLDSLKNDEDDDDDCVIISPPPPTKKEKMASLKREMRLMAARMHEITNELKMASLKREMRLMAARLHEIINEID